MVRASATRRRPTPNGSHVAVESLLFTIRSLWLAVDSAAEADRAKLRKDITQTVNRLKSRVEGRLGRPVVAPREPLLFDEADERHAPQPVVAAPPPSPRFVEPVLRVYAKDFAEHALQHLPQAVKCHSVEEFRNYLTEKLRFNSQATRRRSANYIVSRFFPGEVYNDDLPQFAAATAGKPALGEALFYLTCRTEKIVSLVAEDVVFPSVAQGGVSRSRLREYVQSKFPQSKSADHIGQSIVRSYQLYGIGNPNRTRLNVSLREGCLASFAYVLHLEFPEPGMHSYGQHHFPAGQRSGGGDLPLLRSRGNTQEYQPLFEQREKSLDATFGKCVNFSRLHRNLFRRLPNAAANNILRNHQTLARNGFNTHK